MKYLPKKLSEIITYLWVHKFGKETIKAPLWWRGKLVKPIYGYTNIKNITKDKIYKVLQSQPSNKIQIIDDYGDSKTMPTEWFVLK